MGRFWNQDTTIRKGVKDVGQNDSLLKSESMFQQCGIYP